MKIKHVLIVCVAVVFILSSLYLIPLVIRGDVVLLSVLSGSMNPMLRVGDIIVVAQVDPTTIVPGDVIAFTDPAGRKNIIITHRVIACTEEGFQTKGDACEDQDQFVVNPEDVVGKPVLLLPFIGYLFGLKGSKHPLTFLLLILLPAGLLIVDETKNILTPAKEARRQEGKKRKAKRKQRLKIDYNVLLILFLTLSIPFFVLSAHSLVVSGYEDLSPTGENQKIGNNGVLPCVLVFNTAETVVPYAVLPAGDSREIELPTNMGNEISRSLSCVPYVMPVFWIVVLASINPFLPTLTTAVVPPLSISLLFYPLWLTDIRKRKKRTKRKRRQRLI